MSDSTSSRGVRGRLPYLLGGVAAAVAVAVLAVALLRGDSEPRSVIFINGDGMASAQREAATLAQEGVGGRLAMDQLPVTGLQRTEPDDPDDVVTDSAAAATAWSTGVKTANGRISTTVDGKRLVPLGRRAAEAGKATGIVTTTLVTDASPAAFFASVPDRDDQQEIAEQFVEQGGPDVVLGGGASMWPPALRKRAEDAGYDVLTDPGELQSQSRSRLIGLFAEEEMWKSADEGEDASYDPPVSLATLTRKALDVLSQDDDGFFLFVEEEAVDGMGHANNGTLMLEAMEALDDAVEVARAYVAEHPDTLLVVTGDHEAGGLTVENAEGGGPGDDGAEDGPFPVAGGGREFTLDWSSGGHTGVPTPVTAQGPHSEQLAGTYPNTHVHEVLRDALLTR